MKRTAVQAAGPAPGHIMSGGRQMLAKNQSGKPLTKRQLRARDKPPTSSKAGAEGVCGVPAEVCLAPGAWTHVVVLHDSHVISPELDPPRPGEVWFVE